MKIPLLIRPLCAAGFFLLIPLAEAASVPMLECKLLAPPNAKLGQPVMLGFSLHNRSPQDVWVLAWNTPLEGLKGRFLTVRGPTGELAYQGPMFKRGTPQPVDYRKLTAGQTLQVEVDLGLVYDLGKPGPYTVRYTGQLHDVVLGVVPAPGGNLHAQPLHCPGVAFKLLPV